MHTNCPKAIGFLDQITAMKLKSFGCSFIYGAEMSDIGHRGSYSLHTWPALLAKHLQLEYECFARPGCGNLYIANQILDQLVKSDPSLYVINWTWIDRFDYNDPLHDQSIWQTIKPNSDKNNKVAELYYRHLHSEMRNKITTLQCIKLVTLELESLGYPYVQTYMDKLLVDHRWNVTPWVLCQQQWLKSRLKNFDGLNMVDYSVSMGHKITANSHPLESAHCDLFKYVLDKFGLAEALKHLLITQ